MSGAAAAAGGLSGVEHHVASGIGRRLYPMRIVGLSACVVIGWLYVKNFGTFHAWYGFLLALVLVYPHLSRYLAGHVEARRNVELVTVLVDAFVLGSTVYVAGFSPIPALALLTVIFANGMALGGLPWMGLSALSALVGVALPTLFYGGNYRPQDQLHMNLTSALFLFLYFNLFALVAFRRSVLLQASRREIRQQKLAVEIQKKKSDTLLLSIFPAPVAAEFEAAGRVAARRHDDATVLIADVHEFQRVAREVDPATLLDELNHCFKAFDQIVQRHRLEPLKTVGDAYFAVGGLLGGGAAVSADAVHAAFEMRDFVVRLNETRRAAARPSFDCRFAVHAGPLISGVVETRKFSFEVWGEPVVVAAQIERAIGPGEVAVSEEVLARVRDEVVACPLAAIPTKSGGEVRFCVIEPRPAGRA